jgi:hypothetical protein
LLDQGPIPTAESIKKMKKPKILQEDKILKAMRDELAVTQDALLKKKKEKDLEHGTQFVKERIALSFKNMPALLELMKNSEENL